MERGVHRRLRGHLGRALPSRDARLLGGRPRLSIVANPTVHVRRWEDGALAAYDATATVLEGADRDAAFAWVVERSPGFGDYQTKTDRVIPVVALTPHR